MTDRLSIYNGALLDAEERALAALTDNIEARHLLDTVWNGGGVRFCLEQGQWRFASRAAKFTYEASITPDWGYRRVFTKPTDWVATCAVCTDEYFKVPCLNYSDEKGFWASDYDDLYIIYVSDDADYGLNFAGWPATFTEYVHAHFAGKIIGKLTSDSSRRDRLLAPRTGIVAQRLLTAQNKDAMTSPTKFPAPGSWVSSRAGRNLSWRDRGNRGSLIG